jgi:hypothetical protein
LLHIGVGYVRVSSDAALAATFFCKIWPTCVRHPNLHRAQPCHAERVAMLLNPRIYMGHIQSSNVTCNESIL